jgi:hypothetical protein
MCTATISYHPDTRHSWPTTLDPVALVWRACPECCLAQTWCRCEGGADGN